MIVNCGWCGMKLDEIDPKDGKNKEKVVIATCKPCTEIIEKKPYLKPNKLRDGCLYKIYTNVLGYGIWLKDHGSFLVSRNNVLTEDIHLDTDEIHGQARPYEEIETAPFDPKQLNDYQDLDDEPLLKKIIEYLNTKS